MRVQPFLVVSALFCLIVGPALAADAPASPKPATPPNPAGKDMVWMGAPQLPESCGQPLPDLFMGNRPASAAPVTEIRGVKLPTLISSAPAQAGSGGTVQVLAVICKDGSVGYVQPMRAASVELGEAAQEAVYKWKFHPATKGGEPVAVKYTLRVELTPGS